MYIIYYIILYKVIYGSIVEL